MDSTAQNMISIYSLPFFTLSFQRRDIESTVIKKANQFVSVKFGDIQSLDIMNFLGGVKNFDACLKTTKTNETKYLSYEWFHCAEKLSSKELLPYDSFFNFLRNSNQLEKYHNDSENFVQISLSRE